MKLHSEPYAKQKNNITKTKERNKTNMQIRAKTIYDRVVTIVGFVCKYDKTYAVVIEQNGCLRDYPIEELTVIDTHR